MKTSTSISLPDVLLLLAIAISILLPRSIIPFGLLLSGGGYLGYMVIHSLQTHIVPKAGFGPASAALLIFVFGACLLLFPNQALFTLVISIVVTLIVQVVWIVLRNRTVGH